MGTMLVEHSRENLSDIYFMWNQHGTNIELQGSGLIPCHLMDLFNLQYFSRRLWQTRRLGEFANELILHARKLLATAFNFLRLNVKARFKIMLK